MFKCVKENSYYLLDISLFENIYFTITVVHPGKPAYYKIKKEFGDEILSPDGSLDREKLGQIVFNDDDKRKKLNLIVHPEVKKQMLWEIFLLFIKGINIYLLSMF